MLTNDYNNWNYQYSKPLKDKLNMSKSEDLYYHPSKYQLRFPPLNTAIGYQISVNQKNQTLPLSLYTVHSPLCSNTSVKVSNSFKTLIFTIKHTYSTEDKRVHNYFNIDIRAVFNNHTSHNSVKVNTHTIGRVIIAKYLVNKLLSTLYYVPNLCMLKKTTLRGKRVTDNFIKLKNTSKMNYTVGVVPTIRTAEITPLNYSNIYCVSAFYFMSKNDFTLYRHLSLTKYHYDSVTRKRKSRSEKDLIHTNNQKVLPYQVLINPTPQSQITLYNDMPNNTLLDLSYRTTHVPTITPVCGLSVLKHSNLIFVLRRDVAANKSRSHRKYYYNPYSNKKIHLLENPKKTEHISFSNKIISIHRESVSR